MEDTVEPGKLPFDHDAPLFRSSNKLCMHDDDDVSNDEFSMHVTFMHDPLTLA